MVPRVPSFAVDEGFWYSVPRSLSPLKVGSIVRVPLGGRRVRGWVVEVSETADSGWREVLRVSGSSAVFDARLLTTLEWAADHYLAPRSILLAKATPPNLPGKVSNGGFGPIGDDGGRGPLAELAEALAAGGRRPAHVVVQPWQSLDWLGACSAVLDSGGGVMIVAATTREADLVAEAAVSLFPNRVFVASGEDEEITASWTGSQAPGTLLVGTPRISTWASPYLRMAVILEDSRRAMKERQTPTLHVRDVIHKRSLIEGFTPVFFGPTPSVEALASGPALVQPAQRPWPLVEVVDRREEVPISRCFASRTIAALNATSAKGLHAFVLASKGTLKAVQAEAASRLKVGAGGLVSIGSESQLAGESGNALAVAVNADGWLLGRSHRAGEEALRVLARLANSVDPGTGRRAIVQTSDPNSPLIQSLKRGQPIPYLESVLVDRARTGLPPASDMLVIEIRDHLPDRTGIEIAGLGVDVVGPLEIDNGLRWLLQGDLGPARASLRRLVGKWRNGGATVRIDADPIDL